MSNDDIATLKKFSAEACRDKFAVAADAGGRITKQYHASMMKGVEMADRICCVISPQGKVPAVWSSADPDEHAKRTLAAVETWRGTKAP